MDKIFQLKALLEQEPLDSFLNHALALEYIKLGKEVEAEELFRNVLKHEPHYIGSYYHLGQLLERKNDINGALTIYETGMEKAQQVGNRHAYNELQSAYDELSL